MIFDRIISTFPKMWIEIDEKEKKTDWKYHRCRVCQHFPSTCQCTCCALSTCLLCSTFIWTFFWNRWLLDLVAKNHQHSHLIALFWYELKLTKKCRYSHHWNRCIAHSSIKCNPKITSFRWRIQICSTRDYQTTFSFQFIVKC